MELSYTLHLPTQAGSSLVAKSPDPRVLISNSGRRTPEHIRQQENQENGKSVLVKRTEL
jgi:hypothetical protein